MRLLAAFQCSKTRWHVAAVRMSSAHHHQPPLRLPKALQDSRTMLNSDS